MLSHVQLFVTLWTGTCQAPLSMGFSRQEYWNGLPFPFSAGSSPSRDRTQVSYVAGRFFIIWATIMNYLCAGSVTQLCLILQLQGLQSTSLLCPEDYSGKNTGILLQFPPPGDLPNPGIKTASPVIPPLAGGFFTTEPPGKTIRYSIASKLLWGS